MATQGEFAAERRWGYVATPQSAEEVGAAVRLAAERGLQVVPRPPGEDPGAAGPLDGTVLLRTDAMRNVAVDPGRRTARVGAGAVWADVVRPASAQGLAPLHGIAPYAGVATDLLGGGVSWYGRRYGLASNRVTAVELVGADGGQRRVSAYEDPDLFWAIRGHGGSFGVATAIEFDLVAPTAIQGGALFFPHEMAAAALRTWLQLTAVAPRGLTSLWRTLRFPPVPEVPVLPWDGRFTVVEAVLSDCEIDGDELLAPLRELGPLIDTFGERTPAGIAGVHAEPPEPLPGIECRLLLEDLPELVVDALVRLGSDETSGLLDFEVRHLGGAYAEAPKGGGATAALSGRFSVAARGLAPNETAGDAVRDGITRMRRLLGGWEAPRLDRLPRLEKIKARVDPAGVFRGIRPLAPAGGDLTTPGTVMFR